MSRLFNLKTLAFAAVAALGLAVSGTSAEAGGYGYGGYGYGYAPSYYLKKVVTYDYDYITRYHYVTLYDHCGLPYQAKQAYTEKVAIPVVSYVKVWY
jgi:hypothetical protein